MNNFKFKKSLLAIATGAALTAAGMTAANAESLLFPYWSTQSSSGITSILSLSAGPGLLGASGATAAKIHYVWNYGDKCTHFDNYGSMTVNDLIQQPVVQPPVGTPQWFNDGSTPAYFPNVQGGSYGFLVVSDNNGVAGGAVGPLGSLRGQMIIASASSGIVTGLPGIPQTAAATEGNFSALASIGALDANGLAGSVSEYRLTWYPSGTVPTTKWYGVVVGNMTTAIQNGTNWAGALNYTNNGNVYGRDEDPYSGSQSGTLTCSGILTPESFMNSAQQASVVNGGVVSVSFTPNAIPGGPAAVASGAAGSGVVMTKLETIPGPYTFTTPVKPVFGQGW